MDLFNRKKVKQLNEKISEYQDEVKELNERIKSLESISTRVTEENQKLIKWIENILEQFGTMEVRDRNTVTIPVYHAKELLYDYFIDESARVEYKTIIIPEIVIKKMIHKR